MNIMATNVTAEGASSLLGAAVNNIKNSASAVGKIAATTVAGTEPFSSDKKAKEETVSTTYVLTFQIAVLLYFIWLIAFATGAAVQSYRYNLNVSTGSALTFLYVTLAFLFPFFYYPYYTFFLCNNKGQTGGRR